MSKVPDPVALGKKYFHMYYKNVKLSDIYVTSFVNREFAFSYFGEGGMHRHTSFAKPEDLIEHLRATVPRHAYYSTAYYRDPGAKNMDEKGWLGADLVFDIDVDHIETPCKELHDRWFCKSCGASGWGNPSACPRCGSEAVEKHTWVCGTCINVARDEVLRLIDFLEMDLGFSRRELLVTFSGHRGFHVHVETPEVKELSQDARREIVDYVKGIGLDTRFLTVKTKGGHRLRYQAPLLGWYGRVARWALIKTGSEDPVISLSEWQSILEASVSKEAVAVDEKVTIDTKRLIRLPNSLHGKTGLKAAIFTVQELENLNIWDRVKVFTKGEVSLRLEEEAPKRVLDIELGENRELTLPTYAALYLLLNGAKLSKFEYR
jgi:DNA primase small subunit